MTSPLPHRLRIAPATPDDAEAIATVHVRSWQAAYADILAAEFLAQLSIAQRATRWRDILQKADSTTLVARREADVAGFISLGRCRDEGAPADQGEIWALYAAPQAWGQGVGRALLESAIDALRATGMKSVLLWVLGQNERGIRFYERCGFTPVAGSARLFELGGRQIDEVALVRQADA
jgi:ribosomal protein S18 acetylase RimI-like enzyme